MSQELLVHLLERLSAGDDGAAAAVFEAYAPYLRQVIRRQLPARMRSKLDSVDVLQSAWGDILQGLRKNGWAFATPNQLRVFLVRVMRNRCVDRYRQLRRPLECERSLAELTPGDVPVSVRPGPGEVAQAAELWDRLLALCPPEHHAVLRLKREGVSPPEIAARTGLHEGSVRRILRQLAARLACEPAGVEDGVLP